MYWQVINQSNISISSEKKRQTLNNFWSHRGRDTRVVGFTTTSACNQCLPPLKLWVWTPFMAMCTRYNIMW